MENKFGYHGLNVLYFDKDGEYIDRGRMIYDTVPEPNDIVHPFLVKDGMCNWKVLRVESASMEKPWEIYVEKLEPSKGYSSKTLTKSQWQIQ